MAEHPAVVFLTAALARAEETAKAASRDGAAIWKTTDHPSDTRAVIDDRGEAVVYDEGWPTEEQAEHIALHGPAAVLRRVAADRQILEECQAKLDGWYYGETKALAEDAIIALAEGWGWTS